MAFGVRFTVAAFKTLALSPDGKTAEIKLEVADGNEVTLELAAANIDELIGVLRTARDAARAAMTVDEKANADKRVLTRVFRSWEVGSSGVNDSVMLVFDRGTEEQTAFMSAPKSAREMGRALIKHARETEQAAAKRPRN